MNPQLNELALFAGAGGGILGGKLLGWRTICAVEWDAYAASVLVARQNDGCLPPFPIWDDVQTFDGRPWRGRVDIVSGGFPCQDISCAGKGAGIEGERSSMWKHMARIIGEVLPQFVFVENSPMLVGRGLAVVLSDLTEMGYDAQWGIVGAHHVGAPHKRDRIWVFATYSNLCRRDDGSDSEREHEVYYAQVRQIAENQQSGSIWQYRAGEDSCDVANTDSLGAERGESELHGEGAGLIGCSEEKFMADSNGSGQDMADTTSRRCKEQREKPEAERNPSEQNMEISNTWIERGQLSTERKLPTIEQPWSDGEARSSGGIANEWWATEPDVGRVAHGVAARVDRLRCIGNGQVPAVAQLAWETLNPTITI